MKVNKCSAVLDSEIESGNIVDFKKNAGPL